MQDLETIKAYLNDALLFINNLGVASHAEGAPANLRPLLMARSEAASSMAASIRKKISQASSRLQDAMYAYKDTGTTSDDFSKAMMEFLPGIRGLMEFKDPDSLRLSYDLVVKLSGSSYGYLDMPDSCGYGDRPSDEPADLLLTKLIRKRLAAGEIWDWKGDLEGLDRTSKLLEEYGIEPWYSRSRQALREQVADAGQ
ncbi:hypothetical protein VM1G_07661 [Cytospora mali]|uniref:Uncharacterized protein n=1 Tax=Cytospora mali TaxID=578113 RepID=A0A194W7F0_CYTMA|nr:hypothetical protein VM1G_07661 [Valsa mali]